MTVGRERRAVGAGNHVERAPDRADRRAPGARGRRGRAPDEKRPEPGTPVSFDEELTAAKLKPEPVKNPVKPADSPRRPCRARRCRDAGGRDAAPAPPPAPATTTPAPATTAPAPAPTRGARSTAPTAAQPAATPPAATAPAAAAARGHGCRAWPGSSGRGADCAPPRPSPAAPPKPADAAVPASPSLCRARRDQQGPARRRLGAAVAPARAAGAAAGAARRGSPNGRGPRVGPAATATTYNVYRGEDLMQPLNPRR